MLGKAGGELHNPVIEQRRPHFERMRHTHSVDFVEQVVLQIILLIEQQEAVQKPDVSGRRARLSTSWLRSVAVRCAGNNDCFCSREKAPFQNRCASSGRSRNLRASASACTRTRSSRPKPAAGNARRQARPAAAAGARAEASGRAGRHDTSCTRRITRLRLLPDNATVTCRRAHLREKPNGQRAGIRPRLVGKRRRTLSMRKRRPRRGSARIRGARSRSVSRHRRNHCRSSHDCDSKAIEKVFKGRAPPPPHNAAGWTNRGRRWPRFRAGHRSPDAHGLNREAAGQVRTPHRPP